MPHSPVRSSWRVSIERGGRGGQSALRAGSVDAFLPMERGAVSRAGRMAARDGASHLVAAALVVTSCLWLCGCDRLLNAAPVELGIAAAEERSLGGAIDDLTIRLALNAVFLRQDVSLHRAVSYSVVEGRVLLKGSVPAPSDRARALALTRTVAGVREVIDELQVGAGAGALAYLRDTWISAQLKTRLVLDLAVLHIDYDIETVNGVVYLMGIAQDEAELASVVAHARVIPGARRVANHVMVKHHPHRLPMPGGRRRDGGLRIAARSAAVGRRAFVFERRFARRQRWRLAIRAGEGSLLGLKEDGT